MILGMILKGYKSYDKSIYIPVSNSTNELYSLYIGNNGVGKSAIFEALDTFFNNRPWNITRGATKEEIYISPVFLIKKESFTKRALNTNHYNLPQVRDNKKSLETLDLLSNYFWNVERDFNKLSYKWDHVNEFFKLRDSLKKFHNEKDYFFFTLGIQFSNKNTYFSAFNDDIKKFFQKEQDFKGESASQDLIKNFDRIKGLVCDFYSYIYFPVEQSVEAVLKIETKQMQTLMNKDVLEEIDAALNNKIEVILKGNEEPKSKNIIAFLNDHLNDFLNDINKSIQNINPNYNYGAESFVKKNLTVLDIREKILEVFLLKKSLKYKNKEISKLSSGEQRQALMDIAYTFLSNKGETDREIVLAIDEPEVSMSIASCFAQFLRLEELANKFGNQVLVTTHWYGALPLISRGFLHHLEEKDRDNIEIKQFNFFNYLEERKRFPDDIDLKSVFDLASSILSYMKAAEKLNWIICEGSDDRIYLESILGDTDDFRILPVGGIGNVVKLYNLLSTPITFERKEFNAINEKGKILCLIDTDDIRLNVPSTDKSSFVQLRRLQKSVDSKEIKLVDPSRSEHYSKTVMEDCLNPKVYYESIKSVIETVGDQEIIDVFSNFNFNENAVLSSILGDKSIIRPKSPEYYDDKEKVVEFLSNHDNKYLIAKEYKEKINTFAQEEHLIKKIILEFFNIETPAPQEV